MDGKAMLVVTLAGILIVGAHTAGKGLVAGSKKVSHGVKAAVVRIAKHQK